MGLFINEAWAEAPAQAAQQGGLAGLIFPIGLILILYFFMIRPQIKRQKEHQNLVANLAKGDEVQTIGGLMGRIQSLDDNTVKLAVAKDVIVTVRRQSIELVLPKGSLDEF